MSNKEKRNYELTLILENNGKEETKKKFDAIISEMEKKEVEITSKEEWGLRKLFHEVNKKKDGYFFFLNFTATPETISLLNDDFRVTSSILKSFITKISDKKK